MKRSASKEERNAYNRAYYQANKEKISAQRKQIRQQEPLRFAKYNQEYAEKYPQKIKIRNEIYRRKNLSAVVERTRRYQLNLRKRVPKWLTEKDWKIIKSQYAMAAWLNLTMFGLRYEVDHILPLNGKYVSGLHTPNNLQIVQRKINRSKGNRYESEF